ncbi:unnamed protein product [Heligmosomoides polygyrus]|uniref:Kunitz/Bovine pancreatic trypsin inhibitor domain protein n=1 Tax=Heligmosomoides polygyrus TaxID=6339 RepID=A0A183G1P8_HELPZ|nr:unnamed protein product [Heligmosomoides polygyrus]
MRFLALLTACAVVAAVDAVDPCKRQPFRGRCPSKNGESPKRSQFVLRYYMRNGECVSYPYGHCASDESEPQLYRYKEECEDACINPPPANLGAPKDEFEQTYGTIGPVVNGVQTDQRNPSSTSTTTQCEPDGRQCFCVDSRGIEIANSRTRNGQKPDCDGIQSSSVPRTKECVGGAVRGPCSATMNRWYYDEQEAKCNRFSYSGCGGNGNNYDSEDACIQRCAPPPMGLPRCEKGEPLKTKLGVTVNCAKSDCPYGYKCSIVQQTSVCCPENNKIIGLQTSASTDVCSLPKERGPCDKYELRFYFNAELKVSFRASSFANVNNSAEYFKRAEPRENIPTTPRPAQSNRVHSFRTTQGIRITPGTFTRSEEAAVAHERFVCGA